MDDHLRDRLSCAEILALAERESGANGLLDEGLRARVSAIVEWINAGAPYTPEQVWAIRDQIKRLLTTRLRIALDRQRFPAIAEEGIERPIFIIGFARSGTTMLHSLLAEDPEVLKPYSWHMFSPSPPPGAGPVVQERIAYANRMMEAWMDFNPAHKVMHPYVDKRAYQPIEDEELFSLDFRNAYPFHYYRVPILEPAAVGLASSQADAFRFTALCSSICSGTPARPVGCARGLRRICISMHCLRSIRMRFAFGPIARLAKSTRPTSRYAP